jgi:hypothetical protein
MNKDYGSTFTNDAERFLRGGGDIADPTMTQSFDTLYNRYEPQLNLEDRAAEMRRSFENRALQDSMKDQQQNLLAQQTMRGIATSGLGMAQRGQAAVGAESVLSEKEQKDMMEEQFARRAKVDQLKSQFVREQISDMNRKFMQNMQRFQTEYAKFKRTSEGKYADEARRTQQRMQEEYDQLVNSIQSRLRKSSTGKRIAGAAGGIAGAVLGSVIPGLGTSLGASLGSALGTGIGGLVGSSMSQDDINRYISSFQNYGA